MRALRLHRLAARIPTVSIRARRTWLLALIAASGRGLARADPWLAPGDEGLRSDIQLLADAGILRGPVTTWPMSWPDIARDVLAARVNRSRCGHGGGTAARAATGRACLVARICGRRHSRAAAPTSPTCCANSRTRRARKARSRCAPAGSPITSRVNLQGSYVADPDDDKDFRADGSYLGVNFGNFMFSAGFMERWWGPGWDGSLILSTNARPIPSVTLERNYTDPFKTKLAVMDRSLARQHRHGRGGSRSDVAVPDVQVLRGAREFQAASVAGVRPDAHRAVVRRRPDLRLEHLHRHALGQRQPGARAATRRSSPATRWPATTCACVRPGARCRWPSTRNG